MLIEQLTMRRDPAEPKTLAPVQHLAFNNYLNNYDSLLVYKL
jgi:hypothetical protein